MVNSIKPGVLWDKSEQVSQARDGNYSLTYKEKCGVNSRPHRRSLVNCNEKRLTLLTTLRAALGSALGPAALTLAFAFSALTTTALTS